MGEVVRNHCQEQNDGDASVEAGRRRRLDGEGLLDKLGGNAHARARLDEVLGGSILDSAQIFVDGNDLIQIGTGFDD